MSNELNTNALGGGISLLERRRAMMGKSKPYDAEVEYLESDGTQFIDTGTKGHMNHDYEIDFRQTVASTMRIWGAFGQATYIGYSISFTWQNAVYWCVRWESRVGNSAAVFFGPIDTERHTLQVTQGNVFFDGIFKGISVGHSSNFQLDENLYLFAIHVPGEFPQSTAKIQIYGYKDVDENGIIIRDFIPVRVAQVGYMYDKVSGQLFGNAGTGNFILGNDK